MIESRPYYRVRLVECPLCNADLREKVPSAHIVREHGPIDAGLQPLSGGDQ